MKNCLRCLAAALKGYNVIITLPQKMSGEKVNMMKSLGALVRYLLDKSRESSIDNRC